MRRQRQNRKIILVLIILFLTFSAKSQSDIYCRGDYHHGWMTKIDLTDSIRDTLTTLSLSFHDSICLNKPIIADFDVFPSLKCLSIKGPIEGFSSSIIRYSKLEKLYLGRCSELTALPERIGELENLKYLNFNDSRIDSFPSSFKNLNLLEEVYFASSTMETFPLELIDCGSKFHVIELNLPNLKTLPSDLRRIKFQNPSRTNFTKANLILRDCAGLTSLPNNIRSTRFTLHLQGASNLSSISGLNEGTEKFELALSGLSSRKQLRKLLSDLDSGDNLKLIFGDPHLFKVIPRKLYRLDGLFCLNIHGLNEFRSDNWVKRKRKKLQRKLPKTRIFIF